MVLIILKEKIDSMFSVALNRTGRQHLFASLVVCTAVGERGREWGAQTKAG